MIDVRRHIVLVTRLGLIETRAEYSLRLAQHQLMLKDLAVKEHKKVSDVILLIALFVGLPKTRSHTSHQNESEEAHPHHRCPEVANRYIGEIIFAEDKMEIKV